MKYIFLFFISVYRKTDTLRHGLAVNLGLPVYACKFQPTCSEYCQDAIKTYGAFKGGLRCMWRILRCNPWAKGGFDPVRSE